jgi:signal transduction histidine kinase/DNA-binding NarL/FixJ family response regulator
VSVPAPAPPGAPLVRRTGTHIYVALLALSAVLVVATSILSLSASRELARSIEVETHSREVLAQVNRVWASFSDSESYGLSFLLAGRSEDLRSFRDANDALGHQLDALERLTRDNATQRAHVSALRGLQYQRESYLDGSVNAKFADLASGAGAVAARVRSGQGADFGRRLRDELTAMASDEQALLVERTGRRAAMIRQTDRTVLVANTLALLAGLLAFLAVRRSQAQVEQSLRIEYEAGQARRASAEKSVFLASMSHEIRTPMNAIFGFTQLLSETVRQPLEREYVGAIKQSGQALLDLIDDVLDLSRIEAGKLQLNPQPTDVPELIDQALLMFQPVATERGLLLQADLAALDEPVLVLDGTRVRQVLINLVSNAVKYTESGGVTVTARARPGWTAELRELELAVADTGVGIEPAQRERIFEPFEQSVGADGVPREGTGLGLAIVRRLVDLMGGAIALDSTVGQGSRFTVTLSNLPVATREALAVDFSMHSGDFDSLPPLKVLVVDDVAWNREVVAAYLRNTHHQLRQAADGKEALDVAREYRPDVVLMDIRMPRMGGVEALAALRADPELAGVRVLAVTASALESDEDRLRRRFDDYLRKPYLPEDLRRALLRQFGPQAKAETVEETATREDSVPAEAAAPIAPVEMDAGLREDLHQWQRDTLPQLRAGMRMGDIARGAVHLRRLGQAMGHAPLVAHGDALGAAVAGFDVTEVTRLLDHVPWPAEEPPAPPPNGVPHA